jgi:hypothetical protein
MSQYTQDIIQITCKNIQGRSLGSVGALTLKIEFVVGLFNKKKNQAFFFFFFFFFLFFFFFRVLTGETNGKNMDRHLHKYLFFIFIFGDSVGKMVCHAIYYQIYFNKGMSLNNDYRSVILQ